MKGNKPPDDCTNMVLYGDDDKFISPVWYSCGRCTPCPRDSEANDAYVLAQVNYFLLKQEASFFILCLWQVIYSIVRIYS